MQFFKTNLTLALTLALALAIALTVALILALVLAQAIALDFDHSLTLYLALQVSNSAKTVDDIYDSNEVCPNPYLEPWSTTA